MTNDAALIDGIIERASAYVTRPPRGDDPVVSLAAPDRLIEIFAASVGLAIGDDAPSHDATAVLDAVDRVIEYSVHTSHPRFVNQNFAGPDPVAVVGDWLGAALNTTGATYEAAPVFTMMESAVLTKLARLAGYQSADGDDLPALPPAQNSPDGRAGRSSPSADG